nr:MAG TPA: hypothetical protein [Bacteriophage sp.]
MKIVLTNNARFNPYTFDEMLKPLAMAADAYNTVQSGIEELGAKADLMKMYANEVPDSKTANMYNSYAKDLEKQASMLAKHGLTPASRQGLLNMKRRYNSEVVPIETAVARREALTKEQREALLRDPSLMFDVDYSKTQLDYLLDNPNATYNPISGNELTKRATQMASNLAKVVQGNPKYQSILGGQYFQQMTQMGYTPAQIMQTILNDDNAPAELRQIAETVFNEAGLSKYSQDIQDRARGFINSGLYEGIGTAKYDIMNDRGYISPAESKRLDMAKEQQDWAREQKEESTKGILLPNGNRLKVIGAGRAVEIAPDGTYKPVAFPSSSATAGGMSRSTAEKQATFTTLEYTGGSFDTPGWSDDFSESDARLIDFSKLSPKARKKLQDDLKEYGLSVADVDIYEDQDYFSKNHYRVVRKGAGVAGIDVTAPEQQQQNEGL